VTHDQEEAMTIADRIVVINAGRIEQAGTPAEIYDHPTTRFVADFIGTANLISGTVRNGRFRSKRGLEFPLPTATASSIGEMALAIRPEKIDIAPTPSPGQLAGRVARRTRLGSVIEYELALASGDILVVQEQGRAGVDQHEPGSTVGLQWRREDLRLLP